MTYSSSPDSKMMQPSPTEPTKNKHDAPLGTCHRKKDLFLSHKSDWPMYDLCSALSLWYSPVCITSRILYHIGRDKFIPHSLSLYIVQIISILF